MKFSATTLADAMLIEVDDRTDERGSFARVMCRDEFAAHGMEGTFAQANLSTNNRRGTLRGMHMQRPPHAEVKLVRCIRGAMWDVIVDMRPASPTYRRWEGFELTDRNKRGLYVPAGFAHGFISLTDDVHVFYLVSVPYAPGAEAGIRWDDPAIGIAWPMEPVVMSQKDRDWPLLDR
jgi:dTDP-4-dehydrorhamnose 3,5-epimerase